MSFNVLVVPEDATHDHYVLKPVVEALMSSAGKPRAVVKVLVDPAVHGVDQALDRGFLEEVISRYPMVHLFLICVDRDGKPGRESALVDREGVLAERLKVDQRLFGTAAHQEVEVWCLPGRSGAGARVT